MSDQSRRILGAVYRTLRSLRDGFVQPAPDEVAACDFDCKVLECEATKWRACPRRLSNIIPEEKEL